jgi:cytochrome oxidase Cu insertion factor (SCO1/SenC/PrrC family)
MAQFITALLSVFALLFLPSSTQADPYKTFSVLQIQKKPAPDFSLPQVGGKRVRLSDYSGKVVLLGFFKTF